MIRIGQGFDVHRFGEGDHLILGGVRIPHTLGVVAHSDGDVLLHAICDALLGAAGMGDIGEHFPDTDETFANADSRELLRAVRGLMHEAGYVINNIDATIILQNPKLSAYKQPMRDNISHDLDILPDQVSIKATTTEKLGFTGRDEGIAVMATACVDLP